MSPSPTSAPVPVPSGGAAAGAEVSVARERAERVARASYGRLLAILAAASADIELAEDCLGDAFLRALSTWPETGVPDNPESWLLTVARNRRRDLYRSAAHRGNVPLEPDAAGLATGLDDLEPEAIPDRRLALLFVCAHPAIDPTIRTPLMLQTVLGFDAARVGRAFSVPAATMAQRLVRAKRRIRDARIPFAVPERGRMAARLPPVLEAIYGAYALDWQGTPGATASTSMVFEAHYLASTLARLLPEEPEALGLAALISLSMARLPARGTFEGFVPLDAQDCSRWDRVLIAEGEDLLRRAHALGRTGRFQLEAAIQSVHCDRASSGTTDWRALRKLYAALVSVAPTLGARVAQAATLGRIDGPEAGIAALEAIDAPGAESFQPAWATRAYLLAAAGRLEASRAAYQAALALTTEESVRTYLEAEMRRLPGNREAGIEAS